ncbi:hypothetical protein Tco_1360764 [Tanacetum coccineum]
MIPMTLRLVFPPWRGMTSGLPVCVWGSSAFKKVANQFGKFKFVDDDAECPMSTAHVKEIGTWSIHISNDLESNDSDNDHDFEEHRSINKNVDPNKTLVDFVKQMVEDEDVIKDSTQGHQSDDLIPPDIKKDVAINDEATP